MPSHAKKCREKNPNPVITELKKDRNGKALVTNAQRAAKMRKRMEERRTETGVTDMPEDAGAAARQKRAAEYAAARQIDPVNGVRELKRKLRAERDRVREVKPDEKPQ